MGQISILSLNTHADMVGKHIAFRYLNSERIMSGVIVRTTKNSCTVKLDLDASLLKTTWNSLVLNQFLRN